MTTIAQRRVTDVYPELPMGARRLEDDPVFESAASAGRTKVSSAISEDFGAKLHEAQEKLLELRQQQENLERQRSDLEELRGKQDRFLKGRVDVVERLNKGLTRLDRDTFQARKRLEMIDHAKQNFSKHLDAIEALNPEHWSRADLRNELVRATAALEDAEQDYAEAMARLGMVSNAVSAEGEGGADARVSRWDPQNLPGFQYWLLAGSAFTLPVVVLLVLYMVFRVSMP